MSHSSQPVAVYHRKVSAMVLCSLVCGLPLAGGFALRASVAAVLFAQAFFVVVAAALLPLSSPCWLYRLFGSSSLMVCRGVKPLQRRRCPVPNDLKT